MTIRPDKSSSASPNDPQALEALPAEHAAQEAADDTPLSQAPARSFWAEAWLRFRRRRIGMIALLYTLVLVVVAVTAPMIAGTKPIVCQYKGNLYFPFLGYYVQSWENPIFFKDKFRKRYPKNLKKKDPESWAIWPLVYQDPYRRIRNDEFPGQPANPSSNNGKPWLYYLMLRGWDSVTGSQSVKATFADPRDPSRIIVPHNILGTDSRGFDVFAQMVHGTGIALSVGFVSMGIASVIGVTIGALAGYFGGVVDWILSRFIEVALSIPSLVLILALLAILEKPTIWHLMAVIGCLRWTGIARLTRAEFLKLRKMEYVTAANSLGAGPMRIMFLHMLRNSLAPILVPITFGIASAILLESGLSLLGFGAPPPNPSWGSLLKAGREDIQHMWWLIFFPGLAIFFT
ncbi:MAG: ABC transporter permease, partial [bacterium]|nr:ABC transporter permease [bacterium]